MVLEPDLGDARLDRVLPRPPQLVRTLDDHADPSRARLQPPPVDQHDGGVRRPRTDEPLPHPRRRDDDDAHATKVASLVELAVTVETMPSRYRAMVLLAARCAMRFCELASTFYNPWHNARAAAGRPDLRSHDLRHTGVTLAAATGATLADLVQRLGHSTPAAALR